MTHKKAMSHALKIMKDRLEEIQECAFSAHEVGDNGIRDEALLLARGFIECADLLDKMMMLAEMSDRRDSPENAEVSRGDGSASLNPNQTS